jgi:hypothetical protein
MAWVSCKVWWCLNKYKQKSTLHNNFQWRPTARNFSETQPVALEMKQAVRQVGEWINIYGLTGIHPFYVLRVTECIHTYCKFHSLNSPVSSEPLSTTKLSTIPACGRNQCWKSSSENVGARSNLVKYWRKKLQYVMHSGLSNKMKN